MREVTGNDNVAGLAAEAIADPAGRIIGLKIACRRQFSKRVAGSPERLGGLLRAQFTTVPDDGRVGAASGSFRRGEIHFRPTDCRQRTLRIDLRSNRIAVMYQIQMHV